MGVTTAEQWADEALEAAEFAASVQKRVTRKYESAVKIGDTLHIPRLSNMTASTKSAGTDITFEAITEGVQDVTIATLQYAAFLLEDAVKVQQNQDLRQMYTKKIGYALARATDVTLANLFASLASNTPVGTLGVEMTPDDYAGVWEALAEAGLLEDNPDPTEEFSLFLSPAAYAALLKVDVFINRQINTGADAVARAKVGDIFGMSVYISNLLQTSGSGKRCAAFHRSCFALVLQKEVPVRSDHLLEKMGDGVVGWRLYGTAELNYPPETAGGGSAVDNRGILINTV